MPDANHTTGDTFPIQFVWQLPDGDFLRAVFAAHVEALRVEAARRLLETTDLTVAAIAGRVGLRHAETLHRAFARRLGTTPARYREHFARQPA